MDHGSSIAKRVSTTKAPAKLKRVAKQTGNGNGSNGGLDQHELLNALHAMQAGAMGYLLKNTPQEEIIRAVDMVNQNQRCVSPEIARRLSEAVAREELTQRELEVLKLTTIPAPRSWRWRHRTVISRRNWHRPGRCHRQSARTHQPRC